MDVEVAEVLKHGPILRQLQQKTPNERAECQKVATTAPSSTHTLTDVFRETHRNDRDTPVTYSPSIASTDPEVIGNVRRREGLGSYGRECDNVMGGGTIFVSMLSPQDNRIRTWMIVGDGGPVKWRRVMFLLFIFIHGLSRW